jgi:uncharacterized protein (DUF2235 family)
MRKKTMKSMVLSLVLICASSFLAISASAQGAKGTAPAVAVQQQSKRLAVFLDGTWNAVNDNTNVWRIKALCAPKSIDGKTQLVYYEIGVNGFTGGVFGKGLDENIRRAYEWLVENYNDGDDIFIFGFSRGAYTARALAGLVTKFGLLKPGSPIGITQLFDRYKRTDEQTIWELHEQQDAGATSDFTLKSVGC